MFSVILILLSLCLGTASASEPQESSMSTFYRSYVSDLGEYPASGLLFDLFGIFFDVFYDFNIVISVFRHCLGFRASGELDLYPSQVICL
jgi:hypothetical protein